MSPIIVATDFSKPSTNAANYAADMATFLNTDMILVHVIQIPSSVFQVPMTEFEYQEIERLAQVSLEKLQMELVYRTKNKITVAKEIRYGSVELELEKMSYEKKPFAIVIGRETGHELQRFLVGSTALRLVHHILYPIFIIPEKTSFTPIKNIAIASDFRNGGENASVLFTRKILSAFHASLKIIHVNTNHDSNPENEAGAVSLQKQFADYYPKFYFIDNEKIQDGIDHFLSTYKTDLLIVMPEKRGLFESLIRPHDSNKIILHAHLPVLSIAATKLSQEERDHEKVHSCKTCNGSCKTANTKEEKHTDETHSSI
jgi:nucleotide-binding universal stress UspA family protein